MVIVRIVGTCFAAAVVSGPAMAAPLAQPPMNDFNDAYYICGDAAFQVSYDSNTPQTATVTTSSDNKSYELKRTPSDDGVSFAAGGVSFWTDGKSGSVAGAGAPLKNCRLKSSSS